jgi:hypothetical protein
LLRSLEAGQWLCAVIESNPLNPVYVFDSPDIARAAGVAVGSAIALPVAHVDGQYFGDQAGSVSGRTALVIETRLEAAKAAAIT